MVKKNEKLDQSPTIDVKETGFISEPSNMPIIIPVDIVLDKGKIPVYKTPESGGADLSAVLDDDLVLQSHFIVKISLGFATSIPQGYQALILPRSGLAEQYGLTILNAPGLIDSDFRGIWSALVINLGNSPCVIRNGERIAQVIFIPKIIADFKQVDVLDNTIRGEGGFGHTGK